MALDVNSLNPEQKKAVTTTAGPVLILAGAGSGKTRVLTYRIAYILEQGLARPEEILAVTFTNKAAGEMKERIMHLLERTGDMRQYMPWAGTFHSICVRILRRHGEQLGLSSNFSIYDVSDQIDVVKQAMAKLNVSTKDVNPRAVHSHISSAKNEMIAPEVYASGAHGYFQELVAEIYPEYQKILRENNATDFDDLLLYVVRLWQDNPLILAEYQEQFKYILVDEYQDTNNVQYNMVNMLASAHRNICVVGDDDQSIYGFRGANIKNILNFERDYSDAAVIKLEQNYRSTQTILDAAFEVVSKNKNRTSKKLWTDQQGGETITIYTAENENDEARYVVSQVQALQDENIDLDEIAVLYRTNAQSRALEEGFLKRAMPYRVVGGVRFYERKEIKDVLAYLQLLHNALDVQALQRIINVPRRGIGGKTLETLFAESARANTSPVEYLLKNKASITPPTLQKFAKLLEQLFSATAELNIVELINFVLNKTEYIEMLDDGTTENEARIENLKELITVASKYAEFSPAAGLMTFLEEVALIENSSQQGEDGSAVTLMTIHAAKGLEFRTVFVVGVEEGLFPHSRVYDNPSELEEERRLAYVAITRAKRTLHLVHADSRIYFGSRQQNMRSRFIDDIPEKLVKFKGFSGREDWLEGADDKEDEWSQSFQPVELTKGLKVKHNYFGVGRVVDFNESIVKIDFGPIYGTKELARDLAPIQPI